VFTAGMTFDSIITCASLHRHILSSIFVHAVGISCCERAALHVLVGQRRCRYGSSRGIVRHGSQALCYLAYFVCERQMENMNFVLLITASLARK